MVSIPKQHKAAQVKQKGGKLEIVTVDTPTPGPNQVLIKVSASGVCASDHMAVEGLFPGVPYPVTPGHEVVGTIVSLGDKVDRKLWNDGTKVGVGWNGGICQHCTPCRHADFTGCENSKVTGILKDGGHQEYVVAEESALVGLPDKLNMSDAELAPLLCAGNTVHEALMVCNAKPGDVVIIQGLGGLGHLGLQYARAMGFEVVALTGTPGKADLAKKLGAHHVFAASEDDVAAEIKKLGGAKAAIATAPSGEAASGLIPLLARNGTLVVVGVPFDGKPLQVSVMDLIGRRTVRGMTCGHAPDNEKTTKWSNLCGIKSMVKTFKLDQAHEAYQDVQKGKPQFRNVLVFD